jgi:hypothetical protein
MKYDIRFYDGDTMFLGTEQIDFDTIPDVIERSGKFYLLHKGGSFPREVKNRTLRYYEVSVFKLNPTHP